MANTKMRVVNKFGEDVERDGIEQGEIIVKGSSVINNDETNYTIVDGWLYTGDIGTIDEDGTIKIMNDNQEKQHDERTPSSITHKIERAFNSHPFVLETAVVTEPHADQEETYHAFIVLHPNQEISKTELIDSTKGFLAHSTLLKITITFLEELPRTVSGKILKLQLQDN